jgi:hypothetical protein
MLKAEGKKGPKKSGRMTQKAEICKFGQNFEKHQKRLNVHKIRDFS